MAFGGLGLYYYNEDGTQLHYYWSDMKSDNIYDKYIESGKSEPIKSGYEFKGWSYNGELLPDTTTVDSIGLSDVNISLYAVFGIPDNTKCIFEKGAIDIIVDKIKNSGGVKTSTFTLDNDSSSYTFEVGMTWYEFVNSPYNTNSKFECTSDSNTVIYYDDSGMKFLYIRGNYIEVSGNHYVSNIYYVGLSGGSGN